MPDKEKATSGELVAGETATDESALVSGAKYSTNGADPRDEFSNLDKLLSESLTPASALQAEAAEAEAEALLLAEGAHDAGNARCLAARYAGKFAHNEAWGWLAYDGSRWATEGAAAALDRAVVDTLEARIAAALASGEADKHSALIKACIPNRTRKNGALDLFTHMVWAAPAEFDADPDLLNCRNGVVDLRTGQLVEHESGQRFTHCANADYRPDASADKWIEWLTGAVGSAEIVDWLQLAIGYSLTGHTSEEILFYLFGPPRAGKGLFTETLLALLGSPLAKEVNFATFTAQRTGDSQNFDLAPLKASRLIAASESNAYERFNEAKVKALTGGNDIYCAFKHRDHFNYRPQFKIWLSSNHPVNADPDDDAVWGRLRVIEFPHSHLGKEDKRLKSRMRQPAMLEGVLAWAVAGAVRWHALDSAGLPELEISARLKQQQRGDLDNVAAWLSECATDDAGAFTSNANILASYVGWCEANGVTAKKQRGLSQALKRKGYVDASRKVDGKTYRGFEGLSVSA